MAFDAGIYDAIVIGAGHAGCEAALALARMGQRALLMTLNIDSVALLACNPSIGGTAKGHLVREVDALGGEMGLAIDDTFLQSRMINTAKGPAVHALRAQADKKQYQMRMLRALQNQQGLTLRQGEVKKIEVKNGQVVAVETVTGAKYDCRALVVASGVYLDSRIIVGEISLAQGPSGLFMATHLSQCLKDLGFALRRFKTGTPARVNAATIDFSQLTPQSGDEHIVPFSFMTDSLQKQQIPCYLGYTSEETHRIVRENIHRAPMYRGEIKGVGARYCPSIEDKIVRFADRERHPFFLEPEGLNTQEWYVQGMSTSLPEDVQWQLYRSLPGMQKVEITRLAYAIEYDCIDPTELNDTLGAQNIAGLYFAGQINGSSGYEEAAAQGIYAGINAALYLRGEPPMHINRSEGYIGVMVDDLTTKGTDEPYRMMTARAEYRLLLRQDNADLRLTQRAYDIGLAGEARLARMLKKREAAQQAINSLGARSDVYADDGLRQLTAKELLLRGMPYDKVRSACPVLPQIEADAAQQVELTVKYEGYLKRQQNEVERFLHMETTLMPEDIDYAKIGALRIEARQKLNKHRPKTLGAASRLPGVNTSDAAVLMVYLKQRRPL